MSSGLPKGGYGIIGRAAMRSDKVSKESKAVYALLCSYTGSKHYCYPTVETLAADMQTSERTIIRLTEELQAHGFCKKVKVKNNKRKTAYIPLNPYGSIGDTDDTILDEIGDTDDTIKGDTHGTLILTDNNNSIAAAECLPKTNYGKETKTKVKKTIDLSPIEPVLKVLRETDKNADKSISMNLRNMIRNEIDLNGQEYVCAVVRGRVVQAAATRKPLYLSALFDPDRAEWRAGCATIGEAQQNAIQGKRGGYKSTLPDFSHIKYDDAPIDEEAWQTLTGSKN